MLLAPASLQYDVIDTRRVMESCELIRAFDQACIYFIPVPIPTTFESFIGVTVLLIG